MPRIQPRELHLRIMGVDTAQDDPKAEDTNKGAHARGEEARPGPKVPARLVPVQGVLRDASGAVSVQDAVVDGDELAGEDIVGEGLGGLVVHGVIGELVALGDEVDEGVFAGGDLRADEEEGCGGVVFGEDGCDFGGVGRGGVVYREGDDLVVGGWG